MLAGMGGAQTLGEFSQITYPIFGEFHEHEEI